MISGVKIMNTFAVISDSTCDLELDLRKKYDIDYVTMNYVIDGKEYPASLDWEYHKAKEYYDFMRNGIRITTTQVTQKTYEDTFRKHLSNGKDVLYISCSSALSGSINLSRIVATELLKEFPERKIRCVDSLISSLGQGLLAMKAATLRDKGKSVDEVADFIEQNRLKVNQCGTVETLEYLRRSGRVTASSAFFGNLFGVKPIIISDIKGQNYAIKKVKGMLNAMHEIASLFNEWVTEPQEQCLYISHADAYDTAVLLRDEITKIIPFKEVYLNYIGPIVGASVGPGTVIAFCEGKEVTVEGGE